MSVCCLDGSLFNEQLEAINHQRWMLQGDDTEDEEEAGVHLEEAGFDGRWTNRELNHVSELHPITESALEKSLMEDQLGAQWEAKKWKRIRTLAPAASGVGTVDLMFSLEHTDRKVVVVKTLPLKLLRSSPEEFNQRYPNKQERPWMDMAITKYLNSIRFPWACEFLGVFFGRDHGYIMSSFAQKGDLFSWCQNDASKAGAERETAMRPIVSQIFKGVCWLHDLGIAHNDLSCENVLLACNGNNGLAVKIVDFGMASLSPVASCRGGKPSYQAPEMHGKAQYSTYLADNFAVGVIICCMAVHNYPWLSTKPGKDRSCMYAQAYGMARFLQQKRMPGDVRTIAEVFSSDFLELICGLLAFSPETRYSLGELCFESLPYQKVTTSKIMFKQFSDSSKQWSDASTADSSGSSTPREHFDEGRHPNCMLNTCAWQHSQLRTSIWSCYWLYKHPAMVELPLMSP